MALAFNTANVSAYVDEKSFDFYNQAIMANDVMEFVDQAGYLYAGAKADKFKLPKLSGTTGIKAGDSCQTDFDNGNDVTIDQAEISMVKGFIGDEFCIHESGLEDYFTAEGLRSGQHYMEDGLGAFEAGILTEIQRRVAKDLALNMWLGDQSGDTWSFTGWYEQILAAFGINQGTTTPTSGGSAGTDAQGVFNICDTLINAALANVDFASDVYNGNAVLVMSPKEFGFYFQNYRKLFGDNLVTPGFAQLASGATTGVVHPGTRVPIIVQNSLNGQGAVILTRRSNFVLGVDAESDLNELRLGMDQYEEKIWWKYRFKVGVGFRSLDANNVLYWGAAS